MPPGSITNIHTSLITISFCLQEPATTLIIIPFFLYSFTTLGMHPRMWLSFDALKLFTKRNINIYIYIYSFWDFFCSTLCLWDESVLMVYIPAVCFLCYTVFHCMHLWLIFAIDRHLECFWFGAILKNAAVTEAASYPPQCTQLDSIPCSPL